MSNKLDVDDLINWLNQSEDEAKATVAESGATADPFYDGVLSAIFQIRAVSYTHLTLPTICSV